MGEEIPGLQGIIEVGSVHQDTALTLIALQIRAEQALHQAQDPTALRRQESVRANIKGKTLVRDTFGESADDGIALEYRHRVSV
jgi:hypothetical protein